MSGTGIGTPAAPASDAFVAFVTLDEFATRYENTIPAADVDRVTAFLVDAYALVEDVTGADYIASVTGDMPTVIVAIVCAAARRAYNNPSDLQSETIGDYSWRISASTSGVCFTPAEVRAVRRAARLSNVGSLTLSTYLPMPALDPLTGTYWSTVDEDALP